MEPPLKNYKDGSKSVSVVRDQKVKEIQEEITNNWPEGIITYYLDDKSYDSSIGVLIRAAMGVLESSACIRFKAATDKPKDSSTWLYITNPKRKRECVHDPEIKQSGEIVLILGYDCLKPRDLLHSLLHGIGFKDEVTHPHRDNYVQVVWDNIQPAYRRLYRTQPVEISRSIVEYDPLSIMHFHDRAFSINGKATILPMEAGLTISPSESLSQLDKMRLHLYFGHECNKRKFSSLVETCKMSLKREEGYSSDEKQKNGEIDAQDRLVNGSQEELQSTEENKLDDEEENQEEEENDEDINKLDDEEENQEEEGRVDDINKLDDEEENQQEEGSDKDINKLDDEEEDQEEEGRVEDINKLDDEEENQQEEGSDKDINKLNDEEEDQQEEESDEDINKLDDEENDNEDNPV